MKNLFFILFLVGFGGCSTIGREEFEMISFLQGQENAYDNARMYVLDGVPLQYADPVLDQINKQLHYIRVLKKEYQSKKRKM